jgi:CubicO group peptidase (beta-lactamase class C family)
MFQFNRLSSVVWALATALSLSLALGMLEPIAASAQSASDDINVAAIDAYISNKMQTPRIPGVSVAVVKDDQVLYLKGYGEADPAGHPVTPQTPFVIGSISKSFTALAVMQLVEAGQVDLDAPVQRYLPWFRLADPKASMQITVRELLTMTSGISGNGALATFTWTDDDAGALDRHVRYLSNVGVDFPPGQGLEYSNGNYTTLGAIIQAVSGQSYEDYVQQQILAPLDMQHTYLSEDEARAHGMATGYMWWFGIPVATATPYSRGELPAGFIISSAEDMGHFIIAEMNGGRYRDRSVLSPAVHSVRPWFWSAFVRARRVLDPTAIGSKWWYLPAIVLPPIAMGLSYWVMTLIGTLIPEPSVAVTSIPLFVTLYLAAAVFEEGGWTAYATDPLLARWGAVRTSVVLGCVTAAFHIVPLMEAGRGPSWILGWSAGTVAQRVLIVWLYSNAARSVFASSVFHALINVSDSMLSPQRRSGPSYFGDGAERYGRERCIDMAPEKALRARTSDGLRLPCRREKRLVKDWLQLSPDSWRSWLL